MIRPMPKAPHTCAYFLVGPTATGKTAVAQYLAEQRQAEILSADSMLVYRGMDLGTAKPTPADRQRVRYWGIDVVDPVESFNVARFLGEARRCFESAAAGGRPVIVVGGTGLYIRALLTGLDELPDVQPGVRAKWQAVYESEGLAGLRSALDARSPEWIAALPVSDHANSRRLIRALELLDMGCVIPPRSQAARMPAMPITGLEISRDALVARIEARVREMYTAGLLEEVRSLLAGSWDPAGTAARAIGYAEASACIRGEVTEKEAMRLTVQRTRQLAKRQMTWFRHQAKVSWIHVEPSLSLDEISAKVAAEWDARGPVAVQG